MSDAQSMFSLMDHDSDGEPKGGGKGSKGKKGAKGDKGSKGDKGKKGKKGTTETLTTLSPFSAFPEVRTDGSTMSFNPGGELYPGGEGLHAEEGEHAAEGVHGGEDVRDGRVGYGEGGRYTEEAVYAEGARRQGEDGSVYEDAEEEQAQEEDEEEDGREVDPLYRGKGDDDDTKDPDVEDEYEQHLRGQSSGNNNSGERNTRRKIEATPTTSGGKVADSEMCKVNYDMAAASSGVPRNLEEPVGSLQELHRAQESAKKAILDRIHEAEIHGQDTGDLEDLLSFITLL